MLISDEKLQRLKSIEVDMLKVFIDTCDKLSLRYYIIGGTLLGAVRHKGFIPWDDDIDVGMPREDYDKFLQFAQGMMPEYYFLQTYETDPEYLANFAKIRDSRTTFIESRLSKRNINHGVYIDIFPLDRYTDDKKADKHFQLKKALLSYRITSELFLPGVRFAIWLRALKPVLYLIYNTVEKALLSKDALYLKYPDGPLIANHNGAWGRKEIVPAHWYGEGVDLEFEGLTVKAPDAYHEWLTQVYGDYMQLPPEEERVTHHHTDVIDTDEAYTKYINREN